MRARLAFCCGVGSLMVNVTGRQAVLFVKCRDTTTSGQAHLVDKVKEG